MSVNDITTIEPSENVMCYGCGARHRPLQFMTRYGQFGIYCTAQFTCEEDREFSTPVCVYCEEHYVPEAHRYCRKAPEIAGITAHSLVDERPRLKAEAAEKQLAQLRALRDERAKKQREKLAEKTWNPEEDLKEFLKTELPKLGGSFRDLQLSAEETKKNIDKIILESKMIDHISNKPVADRGSIHVDHFNKKRYVSNGSRWIGISEEQWQQWQKDRFDLDKIPGEDLSTKINFMNQSDYDEIVYGKNNYYDYDEIVYGKNNYYDKLIYNNGFSKNELRESLRFSIDTLKFEE